MSILKKLQKNTTLDYSSVLSDSKFFTEKDMVQTSVPMLNVALSGSLKGGLTPGVTMIAGPSKHFKTCFSLMMASAYLKKYEDAALLFYDSEFGTPDNYFERFEIDKERVIHCPVTDVEQLKHDLLTQLQAIERGEKVIIVLDSLGNLASKKEIDDTLEGKSVADMTRAKQFKSLFRMITPHLTLKDIPMVVINHTYKEIGLFPKDVVGGGTGSYYSSETIWIVGRRQEKEGTAVSGYNFIINVEKSRYVKEKAQVPIEVRWDGGIKKWSGLFEVALAGNFIEEVSKGWYTVAGTDQKLRKAQLLEDDSVWQNLVDNPQFNEYIETRYKL